MSLSFIIDIAIIAIVGLFTFFGYKRGLIKLAIKLIAFFIAIIVSFMFYKPMATFVIDNTSFDESIESAMTQNIISEDSEQSQDPESIDDALKNIPDFLIKSGESTIQTVASSLTVTIIQVCCLIVLFIAVKLALRIVAFVADSFAKLPIVKQFNKLGGTIYGLLEGLLIVFVAFAVISLIAPMLDASFLDAINDSDIGSLCYNNNLLLKLLM